MSSTRSNDSSGCPHRARLWQKNKPTAKAQKGNAKILVSTQAGTSEPNLSCPVGSHGQRFLLAVGFRRANSPQRGLRSPRGDRGFRSGISRAAALGQPVMCSATKFCSRFLNSRPSPRPSPRARGEGERFFVTFTQGGASLALGYFLAPLTGLLQGRRPFILTPLA
jgi:hypothetical protein